MVKNKKKSISKIIISNPISNGLDNDNHSDFDVLNANTPVLDVKDNNLILDDSKAPHELSELIKNTISINNVNTNIDKENIQIQLESSEIIETTETKESTETPVTNLSEPEPTFEKTETNKDNIELSEENKISKNMDDKSDNVELTEIQIKNEETNISQKKTSGCSRGWCSIL
jgi:hypothetical protein